VTPRRLRRAPARDGLVFEPLVTIDEHGLQPMLAMSWESDPRGARWQIRLRSGVQLHDGSTLEAWHVASALARE
jgi:peptide/nickel transport system substrate-binding protein